MEIDHHILLADKLVAHLVVDFHHHLLADTQVEFQKNTLHRIHADSRVGPLEIDLHRRRHHQLEEGLDIFQDHRVRDYVPQMGAEESGMMAVLVVESDVVPKSVLTGFVGREFEQTNTPKEECGPRYLVAVILGAAQLGELPLLRGLARES